MIYEYFTAGNSNALIYFDKVNGSIPTKNLNAKRTPENNEMNTNIGNYLLNSPTKRIYRNKNNNNITRLFLNVAENSLLRRSSYLKTTILPSLGFALKSMSKPSAVKYHQSELPRSNSNYKPPERKLHVKNTPALKPRHFKSALEFLMLGKATGNERPDTKISYKPVMLFHSPNDYSIVMRKSMVQNVRVKPSYTDDELGKNDKLIADSDSGIYTEGRIDHDNKSDVNNEYYIDSRSYSDRPYSESSARVSGRFNKYRTPENYQSTHDTYVADINTERDTIPLSDSRFYNKEESNSDTISDSDIGYNTDSRTYVNDRLSVGIISDSSGTEENASPKNFDSTDFLLEPHFVNRQRNIIDQLNRPDNIRATGVVGGVFDTNDERPVSRSRRPTISRADMAIRNMLDYGNDVVKSNTHPSATTTQSSYPTEEIVRQSIIEDTYDNSNIDLLYEEPEIEVRKYNAKEDQIVNLNGNRWKTHRVYPKKYVDETNGMLRGNAKQRESIGDVDEEGGVLSEFITKYYKMRDFKRYPVDTNVDKKIYAGIEKVNQNLRNENEESKEINEKNQYSAENHDYNNQNLKHKENTDRRYIPGIRGTAHSDYGSKVDNGGDLKIVNIDHDDNAYRKGLFDVSGLTLTRRIAFFDTVTPIYHVTAEQRYNNGDRINENIINGDLNNGIYGNGARGVQNNEENIKQFDDNRVYNNGANTNRAYDNRVHDNGVQRKGVKGQGSRRNNQVRNDEAINNVYIDRISFNEGDRNHAMKIDRHLPSSSPNANIISGEERGDEYGTMSNKPVSSIHDGLYESGEIQLYSIEHYEGNAKDEVDLYYSRIPRLPLDGSIDRNDRDYLTKLDPPILHHTRSFDIYNGSNENLEFPVGEHPSTATSITTAIPSPTMLHNETTIEKTGSVNFYNPIKLYIYC